MAAGPVHLFCVLEQQIEREQFPQSKLTLSGVLKAAIPKYAEFISKEIRLTYLESYSGTGRNIFDRCYVTYADFWIQDQRYRDPDTGQLFVAVLNAELEKLKNQRVSAASERFRKDSKLCPARQSQQ